MAHFLIKEADHVGGKRSETTSKLHFTGVVLIQLHCPSRPIRRHRDRGWGTIVNRVTTLIVILFARDFCRQATAKKLRFSALQRLYVPLLTLIYNRIDP